MSRRVADGATGRVDWEAAGAVSALNVIGNLSVGIWVKLGAGAGTPADGVILQRGNFGGGGAEANNIGVYLYLTGSSGAWDIGYLHQFSGGTIEGPHVFDTNIANDTWAYIGISRDTTAKTVTLYLMTGGVFSTIESWGYTNNPTGGTDAGCRLTEFTREGGQQQLDDCSLAQFTYYNTLLSANQHLQNALGIPAWGPNLLLFSPHWGPGSPDWDLSGNVRIGTLTTTITDPTHPPIRSMASLGMRIPSPTGAAPAVTARFRRTLSPLGTRAGARQVVV